ncbi:mitochondrial assembly of ribosomal large subunit protein 1 [Cheilinus undulatus]|uniref:mitochondrial assembly of ribosomal large subunit protein 1 n=1 Tax=Cheilinus undulatus TaxID=241271 RepID=UPI001BD23792|nr:mitochondrial assembly of ribosomal large subunit protein 1 [Cheilinus undulatus]
MSIFHHSKKLLLSAFKTPFMVERIVLSRSFVSVPKARYNSLYTARSLAPYLSSCQHGRHAFTKRLYSENQTNSVKGISLTQEESAKVESDDGDQDQRSHESFSLDVLVSLLRQENAVDICVIKVPEHIKYAEYFIVVSGVSQRHLRAMALYAIKVYKFLKKDGNPNVKIEGKDAEDWMCIDFGSMVCHFMLPESREVFELEKLWTLRNYDEQLKSIPEEKLPEDFIYDAEITK